MLLSTKVRRAHLIHRLSLTGNELTDYTWKRLERLEGSSSERLSHVSEDPSQVPHDTMQVPQDPSQVQHDPNQLDNFDPTELHNLGDFHYIP
ncbi:unnamed protein product [Cochlearia groenlandica]